MKERLDAALVGRALLPTRERAKQAILAGAVLLNGAVCAKPSQKVGPEDRLELVADPLAYVSRGGLKLERALQAFGLDLRGASVLDLGASTGGFTDCALRHGAARAFCVDVGHGQLHPSLRADPRVAWWEGTHVRDFRPEWLGPGRVGWVVADLSFIPLEQVLPHVPAFLAEGGQMLALFKPQFEVGPAQVGRGGLANDPRSHERALEGFLAVARGLGFRLRGLDHAPIAGARKNIEYLLWLALRPLQEPPPFRVGPVVRKAFAERAELKSRG